MKNIKLQSIPLINSLISLITLIIILLLYFSGVYSQNIITVVTTIIVIVTVISLIKNRLGLSLVYLLYLYLTHLGIPLIDLFTDPFSNVTVNVNWYYSNIREKTVVLSSIGLISFCCIGNLISSYKINNRKNIKKISIENSGPKLLLNTSVLILIMVSIYLVLMVLSGNISFSMSYGEFHANLVNIPYYTTFIFLYAVGMSLLFANMSKDNYKKYIIWVLIPAFILLITGNRGEVLFPLAASIGVLITRNIKINWKIILLGLSIFFILIPAVQEFRSFDFDNKNIITETNISIIDPFITTGYTLRPFVYTVSWLKAGEDPGYGASYFVPFQRGLSNFIPFMEPISYENKPYSFRDRLPTMGYSVIAEAYYNFKVIGIVFVMSLLALLLTVIGDRSNSFVRISILTAINAILINNIRNAFSFVPGQIVMVLLILLIVIIAYKIVTKDKKIEAI